MAVSFATRLDTTRELKSGKYPVVLQVIFNQKVRRKRLSISASLEQWDNDLNEFKKGKHGKNKLNKQLKKALKKANKICSKHFKKKRFDYKKFSELFDQDELKKEKEEVKVIDFALTVSETLMANGKGCSSNDYKNIASAISRFTNEKDLPFSEITQDWLEKFEQYYTSRGLKCFSYMKLLKALYNRAVQKRYANFKKSPFHSQLNPHGYQFSKLRKAKSKFVNRRRIKDLPVEYLSKLINYKPISKEEAKYLNIWFLSYYLFGVNLIDIALLKREHIRNNRWYYDRSKTGVGRKGGKPILPEAMKIIDKYDTGGEYIFDIFNGYPEDEQIRVKRHSFYSGYIRKTCMRISKRLGFDGYFTFYSARYSAATIALNKGADVNAVKELMDHTKLTTTNSYVGRANNANIELAMNLLRV